MPLPPALRDFPAVSVQFLALRTLCVLAVSASGDCRIDSLDGECFFAGPLAASPLPPLTSVTVARVREARNTVSLVVTALCRTIAIVDLDLVARAASFAPLPSPALPITAVTVVRSRKALRLAPAEGSPAVPGKWTLLAALADNSLTAYDLDERRVNRDLELAVFALPPEFARSVEPISTMFFSKKDMRWVLANREAAVACQIRIGETGETGETRETRDAKLENALMHWKGHRLERLME